ncbi:hypothetical protein LTR09_007726 [Extremus antarcticus]|uniref:Uncharacterized protein n=1 Tax=Extremus antarcticus TaxID=702011 RepID=A0AAJ0DBV2_9PEZI|nr:hypothetical protein LTR09_007726 [Extremus antarcticus]
MALFALFRHIYTTATTTFTTIATYWPFRYLATPDPTAEPRRRVLTREEQISKVETMSSFVSSIRNSKHKLLCSELCLASVMSDRRSETKDYLDALCSAEEQRRRDYRE